MSARRTLVLAAILGVPAAAAVAQPTTEPAQLTLPMGARVRVQTTAAPGQLGQGDPGERRLGDDRARPRERAAARRQPAALAAHLRRAVRAADRKQAALARRTRRRGGVGRGHRASPPTSIRTPASDHDSLTFCSRGEAIAGLELRARRPRRRHRGARQDRPLDAGGARRARAAPPARVSGIAPRSARCPAAAWASASPSVSEEKEAAMLLRKLVRLVLVSAAACCPPRAPPRATPAAASDAARRRPGQVRRERVARDPRAQAARRDARPRSEAAGDSAARAAARVRATRARVLVRPGAGRAARRRRRDLEPAVYGPGQFATASWACAGGARRLRAAVPLVAPGSCFELTFDMAVLADSQLEIALGGLARGSQRLDPVALKVARRSGRRSTACTGSRRCSLRSRSLPTLADLS